VPKNDVNKNKELGDRCTTYIKTSEQLAYTGRQLTRTCIKPKELDTLRAISYNIISVTKQPAQ
jgi:hypothetical protein